MSENNNKMASAEKKPKIKRPKKKFFERRSSWFLIGIVLAVVIIALGAVLGIPRGINDRVNLAETQAAPKIQSQLEHAREDIDEGRYEVALSRLDWILEEMFPYLSDEELKDVGELYSQTLLYLSAQRTPTPAATPSPTVPLVTLTPDLRGEEELYTLAQELIAAESWDEAIQTMEALRQKNLKYKSIQVDGMLYVALRNRGVQKILIDGSLEPGIYDLTLAERFAPLDSAADGYRTWARLYLTGASFWSVDWSQVVYYFEQVYQALPGLRDGTNMTATERFRVAAVNYGIQLALEGKYCAAQEYIDKALALASDPQLQPTAQWIADECWRKQHPPTATPTPEPTPTPTPTEELTPDP